MTALAAPTVGLILGLLLLFWGWRGKRIDDHPICRHCGFDLFGLPPDSHRCSECGRDLTLPKSTRIGNRRRRGWIIATGLTLFLVMAGWLITAGFQAVANLQAQMKPVWWLMMDTRSSAPTITTAAMNELMRRWNAGKLSEKESDSLIDRVLDVQGDPDIPWAPGWDKIIEDRHAQGRLADARWQRYWRQAWTLQLQVGPKVRRGDPIPLQLNTPELEGKFTERALDVRFRIVALDIDGNACDLPQVAFGWRYVPNWAIQGGGVMEDLVHLEPQTLSRLQDGRHKVNAVVEIVVRDAVGGFSNMKEIARTRITVEGTFDLVPASNATSSEKGRNSTRPTCELR